MIRRAFASLRNRLLLLILLALLPTSGLVLYTGLERRQAAAAAARAEALRLAQEYARSRSTTLAVALLWRRASTRENE